MNIIKTAIPGVLIIEPNMFGDARILLGNLSGGSLAAAGIASPFVQDNVSRSVKGTLRGLHFQNPKPQGKLVTVLRGAVRDVVVDVRVGSPSFGQHVTVDLDDEQPPPALGAARPCARVRRPLRQRRFFLQMRRALQSGRREGFALGRSGSVDRLGH